MPPYPVWACTIVFFWSISVRSVLYTLLPAIGDTYHLSNSESAAIASAMLLGYSTGLTASPYAPGSRRARIAAGLVLSVAGAVGGLAAGNALAAAIAAFVIGIGAGAYLPQGMALVVEVSNPNSRARNMAVHEVAAAVGAFAGAAYVAAVIDMWTWNAALAAWSVFGLVGLMALAPMTRQSTTPVRAAAGSVVTGARFRLDRLFLACSVSYGAINVLLAGLISVLPLVMVREWGAEPSWAAQVVGVTRLAGLVGIFAAGLFGDRFGHSRVLVGMYVANLVGSAIMVVAPLGDWFVLGLSIASAGSSGSILLFVVVMAMLYRPDQRDRALGLASAVAGMLGNVVCPVVFGVLLDAGFDRGPFWVTLALVAVKLLLLRGLFASQAPTAVVTTPIR